MKNITKVVVLALVMIVFHVIRMPKRASSSV